MLAFVLVTAVVADQICAKDGISLLQLRGFKTGSVLAAAAVTGDGDKVARCSTNTTEYVAEGHGCPASCPFTQQVQKPTGECAKLCVEPHRCAELLPLRPFANPETMQCEPPCGWKSPILGCAECASPGVCTRCASGIAGLSWFELAEDGKECLDGSAPVWYGAYGAVVVAVLLGVGYCYALAVRKEVNSAALRAGLEHREQCRAEALGRVHAGPEPGSLRGSLQVYFGYLQVCLLFAVALLACAFFQYRVDATEQAASLQGWACDTQPAPARSSGLLQSLLGHSIGANAPNELFAAALGARVHAPWSWGVAGGQGLRLAQTVAGQPAGESAEAARENDRANLWAVGVTYLVSLVLFVVAGARAAFHSARGAQGDAGLEAFTVRVSGLPASVVDDRVVAWWLRRVLASCGEAGSLCSRYQLRPGHDAMVEYTSEDLFRVVGVSICYDSHEQRSAVDACLVDWLESIESRRAAGQALEPGGVPLSRDDKTRELSVSAMRATLNEDCQTFAVGDLAAWMPFLESVEAGESFTVEGMQVVGCLASARVRGPAVEAVRPSDLPQTMIAGHDSGASEVHASGDVLAFLRQIVQHQDIRATSVTLRFLQPEQDDSRSFVDSVCATFVGLDAPATVIEGSGVAYAVLSTEQAVAAVLESQSRARLLPLFWAGREYELHLDKEDSRPDQILWDNFVRKSHRTQKMVLGVISLKCAMVAWICFYVPYAVFYVDLLSVPHAGPNILQGLCLGLLVAIGNMIVSVGVDKIVKWAAFSHCGQRDAAIMIAAFIGTIVNTVGDIALTCLVSQQLYLVGLSGDPTSFDRILSAQMFYLVVPGYLVIPHVLAAVFGRVLPYWVSCWLIRSQAGVRSAQARTALQPPGFETTWRYVDILNNCTVSTVMLCFVSPNGYQALLFLVLFLMMVYAMDWYLITEVSGSSPADSGPLAHLFGVLMVVPLGVLAAAGCYWGFRAGYVTSLGLALQILGCHTVVYLTLLAAARWLGEWAGRGPARASVPYPAAYYERVKRAGKTGVPTVFNVNAVHCLRSLLLPAEETGWTETQAWLSRFNLGSDPGKAGIPGCVPLRAGWHHLQPQF